jgi:hypothetical protein
MHLAVLGLLVPDRGNCSTGVLMVLAVEAKRLADEVGVSASGIGETLEPAACVASSADLQYIKIVIKLCKYHISQS